MSNAKGRRAHFLELHRKGEPLLMPNPWDAGTAKLFASLGFQALATTSSGAAATQGRRDGSLSRDETLENARWIAAATELPVSADLENGFADAPGEVAETVRLACETGLAGCSIEDFRGGGGGTIYEPAHAAERVAAAAEAAHGGASPLVLTARAENYPRGRPDLPDTIARLQAYQEAGADVLYAPGLTDLDEIASLVKAVDLPVNVLVSPAGPSVQELASVGVARISVGGNFHLVGLGAVARAARELLEGGPMEFWETAAEGRKLRARVFE